MPFVFNRSSVWFSINSKQIIHPIHRCKSAYLNYTPPSPSPSSSPLLSFPSSASYSSLLAVVAVVADVLVILILLLLLLVLAAVAAVAAVAVVAVAGPVAGPGV